MFLSESPVFLMSCIGIVFYLSGEDEEKFPQRLNSECYLDV